MDQTSPTQPISNPPKSEQLITAWQRRDRALRTIELLVVGAVLLFNLFLLYRINEQQQQIKDTQKISRDAIDAQAKQQEALLKEARTAAYAAHQETIRYLRCLALLQPPYVGTAEQLDNCIRQSQLPDDQQTPPIQGSSAQGGSESTNPLPRETSPPPSGGSQNPPNNPDPGPEPPEPSLLERLTKPITDPIKELLNL